MHGDQRGAVTWDPNSGPPLPVPAESPSSSTFSHPRNLSSTDLSMVLSKHSQNHEPRMPSCRLRPAGPPLGLTQPGELLEAQPI